MLKDANIEGGSLKSPAHTLSLKSFNELSNKGKMTCSRKDQHSRPSPQTDYNMNYPDAQDNLVIRVMGGLFDVPIIIHGLLREREPILFLNFSLSFPSLFLFDAISLSFCLTTCHPNPLCPANLPSPLHLSTHCSHPPCILNMAHLHHSIKASFSSHKGRGCNINRWRQANMCPQTKAESAMILTSIAQLYPRLKPKLIISTIRSQKSSETPTMKRWTPNLKGSQTQISRKFTQFHHQSSMQNEKPSGAIHAAKQKGQEEVGGQYGPARCEIHYVC